MTLTQQIEKPNSLLGGYLREIFPPKRNRGVLTDIHRKLGSSDIVFHLEEGTHSSARSLIGHALDYRIRCHFTNSFTDQLSIAWDGAWMVAKLDDFVHLLLADASRFLEYTVTPFGEVPDSSKDWQLFFDTEAENNSYTIWRKSNLKSTAFPSLTSELFRISNPDISQTGLPIDCVFEFFDTFDETIDRVAANSRIPTHSEEQELARLSLILAVFEATRRSGGRGWPPSFFKEALPKNLKDLLGAIPDSWVVDVVELTTTFVEHYASWHGYPAVLNPEFSGAVDVGGADGDFIVDGCLWEIKTTTKKKAPGKWLYQLLGYALLDYKNKFCIDHVGLLFPRQNTSISWDLHTLMFELSGQTDISVESIRQELFQRLRSRTSVRA